MSGDDLDSIFVDVDADRRMNNFDTRVLPASRGEVGTTVWKTPEESRSGGRLYPTSAKRKYMTKMYTSTAWRKLRLQVLTEFPVCEICQARVAEEVDHIQPWRLDEELFLARDNCQAVCSPCHRAKSKAGR